MLEQEEPASSRQEAVPSFPGKGPSFSGASRNTGPLPGSRSARKKRGLLRRTGIVMPAIGIAAIIVAIVYGATYMLSPSGNGASGLASVLSGLPKNGSVQALESEREQLIVMNAAASTLSNAAKPATVSPSQVIASNAAAQQAQQSSSDSSDGSSGSSDVQQAAAPDPGTAQHIGYEMLPSFGFNQTTEWTCLLDLWNRESGWVYDAENPSGAYGIPQSLPGSKMASAGADWATDPTTQIKWGLGYITDVYGTPCDAWDHETADGWY
ncbi:MAG TPA: hypothetical protein VMU95_31430 [Trebonia sp.]|nr:hypothetical protein [Trebonia sp.]